MKAVLKRYSTKRALAVSGGDKKYLPWGVDVLGAGIKKGEGKEAPEVKNELQTF